MDAVIVSRGLDTNGQNARFVQAARRHGDEVIRSFAIGNADPAGVVVRLQMAAEKYDDLRIRSAHRASEYFQFPADIEWNDKTEPEIAQLIEQADVVHLNNSFAAMNRLRAIQKKPVLLHHHGSLFRTTSEHMLKRARQFRMAQAVSTVDLMKPAPDVLRWLPSAYDIDELQAIGKANRREPDGRIRIVHAPTNRKLKHTDLFIDVVRDLAKRYPIDLVIVEGRTNAETLVEKAKADIVYDQLMFGYGCNSIEAWGMGVPVIAGADNWTLNAMEGFWGQLPFAEAKERTLHDVVEQMVASENMRADYADIGLMHVRKHHDEKPALAKLLELYEEAIKRKVRPRVSAKYRADRDLRYLDGTVYHFKQGEVEVTDPQAVQWLDGLAKRGIHGVEEVA